jgi:hypothetical protein
MSDQNIKNLKVICKEQVGNGYRCTVDMYDPWTQTWEENVPYTARAGDPAPVNQWILEQIATGSYDPISACPIPVPPQDSGSGAPLVV